jgi:hypothetical protein
MAHAYADEQTKIAHQLEEQYLTQGDDTMNDELEYALEKQAAAWDLVKEAAEFKDMSGYQRIQESKGRKGLEGYREGGATTGSRGDYLRSLAGRGTGFYDIKRGRQLGKDLSELKGALNKTERKELGKAFRDKSYKDFAKNMTPNSKKALRAAIVKGDEAAAAKILASMGGSTEHRAMYALQQSRKAKRGLYMRGAGKAGLVAGGLGLAGYGASRAMSKKSSYDPVIAMVEDLEGWEFAKEAELRAAEILLENGVDPETFEETYPESVKLASFPEVGDAHTHEGDYELAEYNEMLDDAAYDILEDLGF